jgi:hypothetical protein
VKDDGPFILGSVKIRVRAARGEFENALFDGCCSQFTRAASLHLDRLITMEERES